MNVDGENILPLTNLSFSLSNSNHCIRRTLNCNRGTGANAASRLDMTFLATNTLSELVWSPKNGLCLKYADCRFLNQEPSLSYALEPIDMACGSSSDKPFNEEIFTASLTACKFECEVGGEGNTSIFPLSNAGIIPLGRTGASEQVEEMENKLDLNLVKNEDPESHKDEFKLDSTQAFAGVYGIKEDSLAPEKLNETQVHYAESSRRGIEIVNSLTDEGREGKMDTRNLRTIPLEKLESTAENDLENLPEKIAFCPANEIIALKSTDMFDSNTQQGHLNGKAIVLADDNGDRMVLNPEGNNSSETVESCNSTGQISTGKRPLNFEQTLIVGNKKFKRQVNESPGSSSRQDSSFMNWISNMTKGFSNSHQEFATCDEKKELGSRNVGFQSIFRSLYSQNRKEKEAVALNADCELTEAKELELGNTVNATPIACCMTTENADRQILPSSERLSSSMSGNQLAPAINSENTPMDLAVIKQSNSKSTENRNSNTLATDKAKEETSSNSSNEECKKNSVEKMNSEMPCEGKTALSSGFTTDPFRSVWITRFTNKASNLFPKPQVLILIGSSNANGTDEVGKKCSEEASCELNRVNAAEASSVGLDNIKGQDNSSSSYKLNVLEPLRYNGPEEMASVFARRLDALKHIGPSDHPDKPDNAIMTCFFCGIKGHHLQECPEVKDTEIEDLVRNLNSLDGGKESSCVCIRCFQLNHWAVSCPSAPKSFRKGPESDASVANQCGPSEMQLDFPFNWKSNEASTSLKMSLDTNLMGKEIASSSGEKKLKENQTTQLSGFIKDQNSDVPNGVFDAIRSLRLTRTDVLKWLNSGSPVSNLDGFFLRLRLGKWEEGLGGTGYYAATISGAHIERPGEKPKGSIPVNVGGIKCLVKTQYISNHDFLEDELRAWWSTTLRVGDNIPSEEELNLKIQEKKRLGF